MITKNPLLDKDFLRALDQEKEREIYARVISLNFNEEPMEEITGRVVSGSVTLDGNSSIRRTCSLSLIAEEVGIHDYYWGINTKFTLEIGMSNRINSIYDDIIWFPLGMYLISTFNTSQGVNNYTISIQGKDKMCLLNGEVGGVITALTHDFGSMDIQQLDGGYVNKKIPIKDIIRSSVETFAKEPAYNIIVNDIADYGVELIEYRGEEPLYFLIDKNNEAVNFRLSGDKTKYSLNKKGNADDLVTVDDKKIVYDNRLSGFNVSSNNPTKIYAIDDEGYSGPYTVVKIESGTTVGYRMTDLTYAGDLIMSVGSTITQMLDQIVSMLGDFEYFYDLNGRFVFQRKRTYVQTSWNNIKQNELSETYVDNIAESSSIFYNFENGNLITSFSNSPNLNNLKNDFSIWGARKSATGAEIPVHLRYAIDEKPKYYKNYEGKVWACLEKTRMEIEAEVREEIKGEFASYEKVLNPNGLSEDWWELIDWAEYYKRLTGTYPTGNIGQYCKEWVKKEDLNLNDFFPPCKKTSSNTGDWVNGSIKNIYIFDVEYEEDGLKLGYFGHGNGCSHAYSYFLDRAVGNVGTSYIYKPTIPTAEATEGFEQNVQSKVEYLIDRYNCEWREIIYQMAVDYMKHRDKDDFYTTIAKNNIDSDTKCSYYPNGITGYEQYYTDMISFWRELYNPDYEHTYQQIELNAEEYRRRVEEEKEVFWMPAKCSSNMAYLSSLAFYQKYDYKDFRPVEFTEGEWNDIVNKEDYYYLVKAPTKEYFYDTVYFSEIKGEYNKDGDNKDYWTATLKTPELLNFWFDFLDTTDGQMAYCSAHHIGDRPKAENDKDVKAIYYRDTLNVIVMDKEDFIDEALLKISKAYGSYSEWEKAIKRDYNIENIDDVNLKKSEIIDNLVAMKIAEIKASRPGYTFIYINRALKGLFHISAQGKSTYDVLNNHLYNFSHCAETISINALPIYYLEPNTRISVKDKNSGIDGEYIVNQITLPLDYAGMMSISATKAVERLY